MTDLFYIIEDSNISYIEEENLGLVSKKYYLDKDFSNIKKSHLDKYNVTTCRVYGIEQVDLTKRNSLVSPDKYLMSSSKLDEFLTWYNPKISHPTDNPDEYGFDYSEQTLFELLKYDVGGFFLKHKDKLIESSTDRLAHTHMCLLYPPNNGSDYEGGDIIFYDDVNKKKYLLEPSKFTTWTFVFFNRDVLHEVTPVTQGTRYVFKAPIFEYNPNYQCATSTDSDCDDLSS